MLQSLFLPPKHLPAACPRDQLPDWKMREGGLPIPITGRCLSLGQFHQALPALLLWQSGNVLGCVYAKPHPTGLRQTGHKHPMCAQICAWTSERGRTMNHLQTLYKSCVSSQVWADADHSHQPSSLAPGRDQRHPAHGDRVSAAGGGAATHRQGSFFTSPLVLG